MNFPMVPPVAINESQEHGKSYLGKIKIKNIRDYMGRVELVILIFFYVTDIWCIYEFLD